MKNGNSNGHYIRWTIRKNKPVPRQRAASIRLPFARMAVGDSVHIHKSINPKSVKVLASKHNTAHPKTFFGVYREKKGYGLWRVK